MNNFIEITMDEMNDINGGWSLLKIVVGTCSIGGAVLAISSGIAANATIVGAPAGDTSIFGGIALGTYGVGTLISAFH